MASLTAVSVIARTGAHGVPDFISRGIVSPVRGSLKGAKGRFCFVSSLACGLRRNNPIQTVQASLCRRKFQSRTVRSRAGSTG